MTLRRSIATCARVALAAGALLAAPGCTLFDDYLPGSPFTPAQPEAAVTVEGEVLAGQNAAPGCPIGGTVFWGRATNTGDVDVADVSITIESFGADGAFLGAYSNSVFNGTIIDNPDGPDSFGTDLAVDESGSFTVCTPIPYGAVARTEHITHFVVIEEVD